MKEFERLRLLKNPHPQPLSQKARGEGNTLFYSLALRERVPEGRARANQSCIHRAFQIQE